MTSHPFPPDEPFSLVDMLSRAFAGLSDGLMPASWLEALIDRLERAR